jgi:hypothetical protein
MANNPSVKRERTFDAKYTGRGNVPLGGSRPPSHGPLPILADPTLDASKLKPLLVGTQDFDGSGLDSAA